MANLQSFRDALVAAKNQYWANPGTFTPAPTGEPVARPPNRSGPSSPFAGLDGALPSRRRSGSGLRLLEVFSEVHTPSGGGRL